MRILLVEDNTQVRKLFRGLLSRAGYDIVEADSIAAAAIVFRDDYFDAVVVDLNLPDGNGADLIRDIKSLRPQQKVVAMSAGLDEDMLKQVEGHVGSVVIDKLKANEVLVTTIQVLLGPEPPR